MVLVVLRSVVGPVLSLLFILISLAGMTELSSMWKKSMQQVVAMWGAVHRLLKAFKSVIPLLFLEPTFATNTVNANLL